MKLLLMLVFVAYVSASGQEDCAWGPSYWCSHISIAKQCQAIEHCIQTVWSNDKSYQTDNGDICQFCENFLTDVKKFAANKTIESEIKQYLDAACGIIPVAALADQCKDTVDNDLNEIFQMLKKMDPKAVCATMGLCSGFQDKAHHGSVAVKANQDLHYVSLQKNSNPLHVSMVDPPQKAKKTSVTGDICTDCKALINDMKAELTSKETLAQVEAMLKEQLCAQLGPVQDECNDIVDLYTPQLLQMLAQEMDATMVCGAMGFCQGDCLLLVKMKLKESPLYKEASKLAKDSEECVFCKVVMAELDELAASKAVQADIEKFIENELCAKLGSLKDVCDQTVVEYGQFLFSLLAHEDPANTCSYLGLCAPIASSTLASVIRQNMAQRPLLKAATPPVTAPVSSSAVCVLCEFIMTELDEMLDQNATKEEIEMALDKVCDMMPDTIKLQCTSFVNQYTPAIVDLLEHELSADMVCTMLDLCSSKMVKPVKEKLGDESCDLCKMLVQYVDSLLKANTTTEEIENLLDTFCSYLPDSMSTECVGFVKQYTTIIIELLEQELTPDLVCSQLGLCTGKKVVIPTPVKDAEECSVCEIVVQYVDSLLNENSTTKDIDALLEKVCNVLPSSLKQQCDDFVKQYGEMITKLILSKLTPEEVCQSIGLCPKAVHEEVIKPVKVPLLGENECTYGPAFWCGSMENAKKCKAVDHCKKHVWKSVNYN